jgi:hypothetical protein
LGTREGEIGSDGVWSDGMLLGLLTFLSATIWHTEIIPEQM